MQHCSTMFAQPMFCHLTALQTDWNHFCLFSGEPTEPSKPQILVGWSWTPEKLHKTIKRLRSTKACDQVTTCTSRMHRWSTPGGLPTIARIFSTEVSDIVPMHHRQPDGMSNRLKNVRHTRFSGWKLCFRTHRENIHPRTLRAPLPNPPKQSKPSCNCDEPRQAFKSPAK